MFGYLSHICIMLCLACCALPVLAGDALVVRNETQLTAALASGRTTPLDALTPYGKRSLLRSLIWGENGVLVGFNTSVLTRELDANQLTALLDYLGAESYVRMISGDLDGPPLRLPEPSSAVEERWREFERLAREDAERRSPSNGGTTMTSSAKLLAHYRRLFNDRMAPPTLQKQPLGDLLPLFEAAYAMNFYHPGTALGDIMSVHGELASRQISTVRWIDKRALDALLAARRFEEARAFATSRPALARRIIPKVVDPLGATFSGRSLYRYEGSSDTLTREPAPAPNGVQLVLIVQEHCQPSARALQALREDADLQARLRQANLLLLTDPSNSIPFRFISTWNAANPELQMRATYSIEEWKDVVPTGVPEFFVLKDGRPVGRLVGGWPPEGNKAALLSLIDKASR